MKFVETTVDRIFGGPGVHNPNEINPYVGCMFHCAYCYVNGNENPQQKLLLVKTNAPEMVKREIAQLNPQIAIFFSSQTDPYTHAERKYGLTRRCIEQVLQHPAYNLSILTKSDLVLRDLDLLEQIKSEVQFSITVLDEAIRKVVEPYAPPVKNRLRAIEELERHGIPTAVRLKPVLPYGLTPVKEIVETVAGLTSGPVIVQGIELGPPFSQRIAKLAHAHFPDRYHRWTEDREAVRREHEELEGYLRTHPRVSYQDVTALKAQLERVLRNNPNVQIS